MSLTFPQLFEYLRDHSESHRVVIGTKTPTFVSVKGRSWWQRKNLTEEQRQDNKTTIKHFKKIVQNAVPKGTDISAVVEDLTTLHRSGHSLTANKLREVYQKVIASQLTGIRKIATLHLSKVRIVYNTAKKVYEVCNRHLSRFRQQMKEKNQAAWKQYLQELTKEWGRPRVERVLNRYKYSFTNLIKSGKPLRARDVNTLTLGLVDFFEEDLERCLKNILKITSGKADSGILPAREKRLLMKQLDIADENGLNAQLQNLFQRVTDTSTRKLPPNLYALVQNAVHASPKELELSFHGKPSKGVVIGHLEKYKHRLFYIRKMEDKQRLQLYHKLMNMGSYASPNRFLEAYDEILTKGLVKKEMDEGMLVPTPLQNCSWLRVNKKIITGRAKLCYHLEQANGSDTNVPDFLIYRSTTRFPSAVDSFTSWVTNTHPTRPPGYYWKRSGETRIDPIFHANLHKELRVVGHSLGGSFAMLAILNRIKKNKSAINKLPKRHITVVTFDSPAIRRKACHFFAKWIQNPKYVEFAKRLAVHHYFSKGDYVPGAGGAHLGCYADKSKLREYSVTLLERKNDDMAPLKLHPHTRLYFSTKEGSDFSSKKISIEKFDNQKWRRFIEILRRVLGCFILPIAWTIGFTKRFFFGRRGRPSGIRRIWNRIFSKKKPVPASG